MNRTRVLSVLAAVIVAGAAGLAFVVDRGGSKPLGEPTPSPSASSATPPPTAEPSPPSYVGARACASCHAAEVKAWTGSHHELAMQEATPTAALGDFNAVPLRADGVTTSFSRRGDEFFVRTDGPDGNVADFRVRFVFGVVPLQQYLVELPGGRLQALRAAWDSRPKQDGGQRWFHLYPGERIPHDDELHWTRLSQNWNHMCAECHSTNVRKGYDPERDAFDTTWSELNVSCEACHGPASQHVAWAQRGTGSAGDTSRGLVALFDERRGATWTRDPATPTATRSSPRPGTKEIETCARCHARRALISEDYVPGRPLLDTHLPALLAPPNYHADGQIREEDYEYASFLQSKMYERGVTCSDCHEPHGLGLRAPGNALCATCHDPGRFDSSAHHFHTPGSPGAACVNCHMPEAKFMVVDGRRDHSIRIPRPDLSRRLGTPNACNGCHGERDAAWAEARVRDWYGAKERPRHFGEILLEARRDTPTAADELVRLATTRAASPMVRATAISEFAHVFGPKQIAALPALLGDASPLVRRAALTVTSELPPTERIALVAPLLDDPVRGVRIEAARGLAGTPRAALGAERSAALGHAEAEYVAAMQATAEHPQSSVNLGLYYLARGEDQRAEEAYRRALRLASDYVPAWVNLADLERARGDEGAARAALEEARSKCAPNAAIEHALGLSYVRTRDLPAALVFLREATRLAPEDARYGYVLSMALDSAGEPSQALRELERVRKKHPSDRDILRALLESEARAGHREQAETLARELAALESSAEDATE